MTYQPCIDDVAHIRALDHAVTALVQSLDVGPGRSLVEQAEIVAFDKSVEYSAGVYSLSGQKTSDSTLD